MVKSPDKVFINIKIYYWPRIDKLLHKIEIKELHIIYKKKSSLYVQIWMPDNVKNPKILVWIHWMDSRGFTGNELYSNFAKYFVKLGYPVILFDQLGSGKSIGKWEFPKKQAHQVKLVIEKSLPVLQDRFYIYEWLLIGLGHSLGGVTVQIILDKSGHYR